MDLSFAPREQAWQGRGRRPRAVPDEVLVMLRAAADGTQVGVLRIGPEDSAGEVSELLAMLRAGARQLGGRLRTQPRRGPFAPGDTIRYEVWGIAG